ncbi:hypothetical protein [Lacinutrix undariae]
MAPIKFENTIKETLEKREISPSEASWDKLNAQLDADEKRSKRKLFLWFGVAASVVGVILVSSIFFKTSTFKNESPVIVNSEVKIIKEKQTPVVVNDIVTQEKTAIVTKESTKKATEDINKILIKTPSKVNAVAEVDAVKIIKSAITTSENITEKTVNNTIATVKRPTKIAPVLNTDDFETLKVKTVIAQIESLQGNKGSVSDAELDALLKSAENEIFKNRLYNETTKMVDANSLLQDVEAELQDSFRTRVFESLKSTFKTVKTAVAERNQ